MVRTVLLVAVVAWIVHRSRPGQRAFPLVALWTAFALYGALFTARPYPHYLLQAAPPLALLAAGLAKGRDMQWLPNLSRTRWVPLFGGAGAALLVLLAIYLPWPSRLSPTRSTEYYWNFLTYAAGFRTQADYHDFFDRRVNRNQALAAFLREHASPNDYLFVWGEEPWLYPLSGLRLGTPYSVAYFAYELPGGLGRIVDALRSNRPTYVVWTLNRAMSPLVKAELERGYTSLGKIENAEVFVNSRTLVQRGGRRPQSLDP
jgi:hypothetical protein